MEIVYDKLVRDNIPQMIQSQGKTPVVRVLSRQEYLQYLQRKLREELDEFASDPCIEEFCDMAEVLGAVADAMGFSGEQIEKVKKQKADKNGAFAKRLCLEKVIDSNIVP